MAVKFFLTKYLLYDLLLRYGGEVFLERRIIFSMVSIKLAVEMVAFNQNLFKVIFLCLCNRYYI